MAIQVSVVVFVGTDHDQLQGHGISKAICKEIQSGIDLELMYTDILQRPPLFLADGRISDDLPDFRIQNGFLLCGELPDSLCKEP